MVYGVQEIEDSTAASFSQPAFYLSCVGHLMLAASNITLLQLPLSVAGVLCLMLPPATLISQLNIPSFIKKPTHKWNSLLIWWPNGVDSYFPPCVSFFRTVLYSIYGSSYCTFPWGSKPTPVVITCDGSRPKSIPYLVPLATAFGSGDWIWSFGQSC